MSTDVRNYIIKIRGGDAAPEVLADRELFIDTTTNRLYYGPPEAGTPREVKPYFATRCIELLSQEVDGSVLAKSNTNKDGLNVSFSSTCRVTDGVFSEINAQKIIPAVVYNSLQEAHSNLSSMSVGQLVFIRI